MTVKIITKEQAIVGQVKRLAAMGVGLKGIATALNSLGPKFAWEDDFPGKSGKWTKDAIAYFMDTHYLAHDPDIDRNKVRAIVKAWLDTGLSNGEVAAVMNRLGYLTASGKPFNAAGIKYIDEVGLNDE